MLLVRDILDNSAALLNDRNTALFTYAVQLPYFNIALDELQETMEQNNISFTNSVLSNIRVNAGQTEVPFSSMPTDLVEIRSLWERSWGSNENFQLMKRTDFLPPYEQLTTALIYWTWQDQKIKFIGATSDREVRIQYIAKRIPTILTEITQIDLINAKTFLEYRTAALCAQFVGENSERAAQLNGMAQLALDRFLIINTKGRQPIVTRRRPFMASYKIRTGF